jgi:hypothetical protein
MSERGGDYKARDLISNYGIELMATKFIKDTLEKFSRSGQVKCDSFVERNPSYFFPQRIKCVLFVCS